MYLMNFQANDRSSMHTSVFNLLLLTLVRVCAENCFWYPTFIVRYCETFNKVPFVCLTFPFTKDIFFTQLPYLHSSMTFLLFFFHIFPFLCFIWLVLSSEGIYMHFDRPKWSTKWDTIKMYIFWKWWQVYRIDPT